MSAMAPLMICFIIGRTAAGSAISISLAFFSAFGFSFVPGGGGGGFGFIAAMVPIAVVVIVCFTFFAPMFLFFLAFSPVFVNDVFAVAAHYYIIYVIYCRSIINKLVN